MSQKLAAATVSVIVGPSAQFAPRPSGTLKRHEAERERMARVPLSDAEGAELVRILNHAPGVMDKWLALDAELMN